MKEQILQFLGVLSWDLNYVFWYHKPSLESSLDFSSVLLLHPFKQQWCHVTEWHCPGHRNDREGILLKLPSDFSNTICIQQKDTMRQTEHSSFFWPTKSLQYVLFPALHLSLIKETWVFSRWIFLLSLLPLPLPASTPASFIKWGKNEATLVHHEVPQVSSKNIV